MQLDVCAGKTEGDFQPSKGMLDKAQEMPFEQLHEDFGDLKFFLALQDLFQTCGYNEFSWRDLYAPTFKRLRLQLSAVINLAKFREEQLKVYAELNEPVSLESSAPQ